MRFGKSFLTITKFRHVQKSDLYMHSKWLYDKIRRRITP